jgi:hypothetical protein
MHKASLVRDLDLRADADGIGFRSHTYIADCDVIIACGETLGGEGTQCDVEVTSA